MQKFFTGLMLMLSSSGAAAQVKNATLETGAPGAAMPIAVAINPRNSANIVAIAPATPHYSIDNGATWQKAQITSLHPAGDDPAVICDGKGDFYYIHRTSTGNMDMLVCHVSRDGGKTWDGGSLINEVAARRRSNPFVVVDEKQNVMVTWTEYNGGEPCASAVFLSRSSNGRKWSKPVQISQTTGGCVGDNSSVSASSVAVSPDDRVYVGWAHQGTVYMDRSFNKGDMWLSSDIAITPQRGGWQVPTAGMESCPNAPMILTDRSSGKFRACLYNVWSDQRSGQNDGDIWFIRSINFGDNWTTPLRVNDDAPGSQQYMPAATMDQSTGFIYIVYYDRRDREGALTDVYLAYSDNGGGSFRNVKINDTPFMPATRGIPPAISAHKNTIVCGWEGLYDGAPAAKVAVLQYGDLAKAK